MTAPQTPELDPRIFLAAERTFLAWIRTGLALMGFGFVVARFGLMAPAGASRAVGTGLLSLAVAVTVGSAAVYVTTIRRMGRGEPFDARPSWLALMLAGFLVVLGGLTAIYLLLWAPNPGALPVPAPLPG